MVSASPTHDATTTAASPATSRLSIHRGGRGRSGSTSVGCSGSVSGLGSSDKVPILAACMTMQGLMQNYPLTIPHFFNRAETLFFDKGVVTATPMGKQRVTYGEWAARTRRLGGVLDQLGISADGRVGTFGWNSSRHLELYFAAPCTGRVLHTLNIRLFPEQVTYVVNHAEDEVIFVDRSLIKLLWPLVPTFETVRHLVVMDDGVGDIPDIDVAPDVHDYEALLADAEPVEFDVDDENQAASMCYTSGTTGNPKGVVYSHRSTYLHTMAAMLADGLGARESDVILPVVPDVPCQRVGPRPRRGRGRRQAGDARAPTCRPRRSPTSSSRSRSRWPPACRPSGWACCPSSRDATRRACASSRVAGRPCPGSCRRATAPRPACRSPRRGA